MISLYPFFMGNQNETFFASCFFPVALFAPKSSCFLPLCFYQQERSGYCLLVHQLVAELYTQNILQLQFLPEQFHICWLPNKVTQKSTNKIPNQAKTPSLGGVPPAEGALVQEQRAATVLHHGVGRGHAREAAAHHDDLQGMTEDDRMTMG